MQSLAQVCKNLNVLCDRLEGTQAWVAELVGTVAGSQPPRPVVGSGLGEPAEPGEGMVGDLSRMLDQASLTLSGVNELLGWADARVNGAPMNDPQMAAQYNGPKRPF